MKVLMVTSVWPTPAHPERAPFIVRQAEFIRRRGITVDVVHVDGQSRPDRYFACWRDVRALMARNGYDVIHAQWGQSALAVLPRQAPLVVTFRGSDLHGIVDTSGRQTWSGLALTRISTFVATHADQVIVVSPRLARQLPDIECHVIPSGLDLERFRPLCRTEARSRLGLSMSKRYVLFGASPNNPIKRYALAREAVESLSGEFDADLLIAAGVPPNDMPWYMAAADLLLLTSAHEGSPNVVKEALACDVPVVSVDVGDVRDRLQGIEGCVVCGDDRPSTIAEAIARVLCRGGSVQGREAVRDLDETALTNRVIAVYERAIAGAGHRQRAAGRGR
jgi:glycosyltransferase involved in cell wall biosynthesis